MLLLLLLDTTTIWNCRVIEIYAYYSATYSYLALLSIFVCNILYHIKNAVSSNILRFCGVHLERGRHRGCHLILISFVYSALYQSTSTVETSELNTE